MVVWSLNGAGPRGVRDCPSPSPLSNGLSCLFSFPKAERLRKRAEFLALSQTARKAHAPHFLILKGREQHDSARLGVTVSRKVGNSVVRNRVKRVLREFYRQHKQFFAPVDYNIIARPGAEQLDFTAVCQELINVLRR